ncbi:MAG TPA: hypothetical protein VFE66_09030 [Bacteroidales bacterium]|nr:hypothetical protein [Bacteroidales bacterium]
MKKLLLLPFLFLIFISCDKKDNTTVDNNIHENNYPKLYIDDSIRNLCFNTHSYWIYQDSASHYMDCTYIVQTRFGFYDVYFGLGNYFSMEYYSMDFWGHPENNNSKFILRIEDTRTILNPKFYGTGAIGPVLFWVNYSTTIIDSLKVSNTVFYKVQVSPVGDTDYYTVANYGVIRKRIHAASGVQIRNLIRWKIVK